MKKFFQNTVFIFLALSIWGYANGLRPNNYKKFMSNLLDKYGFQIRKTEGGKKSSKPSFQPEDDGRDDNNREDIRDENQEISAGNSVNELQPLPRNPFEAIDKRARQCPQKAQTTITKLANYLQQNTETDIEKARAIYVWLTDNISYADDEYNSGKYGDMSADGVLWRKKAVCEGFANLYLALGKEMGLKIEKVIGYSKGYGYAAGTSFKEKNHAWNVIKINDNWHVFDATWGEGSGENVNGKLVSKKKFDDYWFNLDPYEAIFSHFPENEAFAFVQPSLTLKSYERLPEIDNDYFKLGFDGRETYKNVLSDKTTKFPKVLSFDTYIKKRFAPKYETLFISEAYAFDFYIPRGLKAAIVDANENWTCFDATKGQFTATYTPNTEGDLRICVKDETDNDSYTIVMKYNVKRYKSEN